MVRLYLHIGYPKSGTTALQTFLAENAASLAQAGVLYPETGRMYNAHLEINFALGIGRYNQPEKIETKERLAARLRDEIQASGCERVVISSEHFILGRSLESVCEFFADFDVKIIVYLRRHDYVFESGFNQALKTVVNPPWQPTIESYILYNTAIESIPYNYLETLRKWADRFGQSAIVVRPYEKQQNIPDIFADFLKTIEVSDSPAFVRRGNVNASLGPIAVAAIQAVRSSTLDEEKKARIIGQLMVLSANTSATGSYLSPSLRNAVISVYKDSYRTIAQEFMGQADGVLFRERTPTPNDPWVRVPEIGPDDVLDLVLKASSRLIR